MNGITKLLFVLFVIAYWVSPIDLAPGLLVDDEIVTAAAVLLSYKMNKDRD